MYKVGEDISRDNIDNAWKSKKIENKLRKLAFCVADLEHLIKSSINRSHLGGANRFFFGAMASGGNPLVQRSSMQDFRAFPLFLRQEIWDDLANPDQTQLTRVDRLARYLVNELGLRHPSEPSQAVMSALVGARDNLQIPQLRTLLQTVKSVVRRTVTRANHAGIALPAGTYLEVLPNQVQELPDAVRQQVAPGGFAAVPANVSLDVVWQTARTIPLRSTHRDVQLQRQLEKSLGN